MFIFNSCNSVKKLINKNKYKINKTLIINYEMI